MADKKNVQAPAPVAAPVQVKDAPERIWTCNETRNIWVAEKQDDTIEYIRADLVAAPSRDDVVRECIDTAYAVIASPEELREATRCALRALISGDTSND
jgi:hypothetical protein